MSTSNNEGYSLNMIIHEYGEIMVVINRHYFLLSEPQGGRANDPFASSPLGTSLGNGLVIAIANYKLRLDRDPRNIKY